ncbi:MAG: [Fe-Fe] hydrogenase large subunit C-terminal domain-containing protein [Parcubacteria group bacterium]
MQIKINKKEYAVKEGETVLDVCRREGIRIPTLCSFGKLKKEAVCRLCLVEVNESGRLVTSCTTKVAEGMTVETENENIQKARAINLELLWSDHAGKCAKCKKNQRCELQKLAEEYKIENFHFVPRKGEMTSAEESELLRDNWSRTVLDDRNPVIERDSQYCVECRRCINICPVSSYGFNHRAGDVVVGTPYNEPLDCIFCGACVAHCPTGALSDQGNIQKIITDLDDINILSVALVDPAVLKSVEQELGLQNPSATPPQPSPDYRGGGIDALVGNLRALGFEKVFDLTWGFEKYFEKTLEEIHPYHAGKKAHAGRSKFMAGFCPSAELYVKKFHPELAKYILETKRPEELMAVTVKNEYAKQEKIDPKNIRVMLVSACTARKKLKSAAIDHILTVRELRRVAREKKIESLKFAGSAPDKFMNGADAKYAELYKYGQLSRLLAEKIKGALTIGAANGVAEIENALGAELKKEKRYDFLEMMICPGGCEKGEGQSIK